MERVLPSKEDVTIHGCAIDHRTCIAARLVRWMDVHECRPLAVLNGRDRRLFVKVPAPAMIEFDTDAVAAGVVYAT